MGEKSCETSALTQAERERTDRPAVLNKTIAPTKPANEMKIGRFLRQRVSLGRVEARRDSRDAQLGTRELGDDTSHLGSRRPQASRPVRSSAGRSPASNGFRVGRDNRQARGQSVDAQTHSGLTSSRFTDSAKDSIGLLARAGGPRRGGILTMRKRFGGAHESERAQIAPGHVSPSSRSAALALLS